MALTMACGAVWLATMGFGPKPISHMSSSRFQSPEEIGATVYRKLRPFLRESQVWFFGDTELGANSRVWQGLLDTARADQEEIVVVSLSEAKAGDLLAQLQPASAAHKVQAFAVRVQDLQPFELGNFIHQLRRDWVTPHVAITLAPLAVTTEEVEQLSPACPQTAAQLSAQERLACASLRNSKRGLRRKFSADQWVAAMDQLGMADFVLYIHPPK